MSERFRVWVGLKKFDDAVGDKIYEANARMGVALSVLTAFLEVLMIVAMLSDPEGTVPAGYEMRAWVNGHLTSYFVLLGASVVLFVCSMLYLRGKARNRWVPRVSVFLFQVASLAFGIYISSIDYEQGRLILTFVTMVVMCSCLFIVVPIVTFCTNTIAFIVFLKSINVTASVAGAISVNLFTFWLVTLAVSIVRFNEKRNAVEAQREVTEQSHHDALTGLKNRRSLNEQFDEEQDGDVILVMLDVDDFKFFNDAYGHTVGDSVLVQFARALTSVFPADSCYRSGGDEFLIIARGEDETTFRGKLHDLHLAIGDIAAGDEDLMVSSSVGAVCGHVRGGDDLQNMLRIADIAMYEAKRQGKDRVVFKYYDAAEPEEGTAQTPRMLAYKIEETDLLTGLPNYTHFRNRAARALRNPSGYEGGLAFVYFDVANFKAFNHEYGYEGGDAYLQSLADVLRDVFKGQLIARFGEDRFVVLTDRDHVAERVTDVHERAHGYQRGVALELKAGICFPAEGETDVSAIYDRAKLACDSIKTEFDLVYRVYDEELDTQTVRRNYIVNSIGAAIENGWIQVYYQPVMRTQTLRLCGAEALARWIDPKLGMIGPGEFIGVLEQHHLIDKLDVYMLRTICENYRKIVEAGIPPVPVSLNLSRLDFELRDIFEEVESLVAEYGVPKSMLHLEVTESALADNSELIKEQIKRFRAAGYQVWMDDFGSGYSSLNLLKEYEFDLLKIDMVFLRGLEEHRESRVIISSIVDMAKQLGIQTLAEGVETREQLEFLREIGCEKLQGFLFSKPRPFAEIVDMIHSGKMDVELMESRAYYTATGKVNIIGRSPAAGSRAGSVNTGVLPLAIIEYRGGRFHYLAANRSYRDLMGELEVGTLEDAEKRFGEKFLKPLLAFTDVCRRVKREGGARSFDHITFGHHCNTRVSYIASDGDRADAFLICTISDADLTKSIEESTLQETLRFIYSVYTRVDLIAEDNSLMENIYLNSGQYNGEFVRDDARASLSDYAEENIHPDDRARFLEYYNMGTIAERLEAHTLSHLSAFFRTVTTDGGYAWQFYMLIPMDKKGRRFYLSCVRDVDAGAVRFLPEAGGVTTEAMLWESFVKIDDLCVFWKDGDGRFVGANRAFMDFYGFKSAAEFVGKTDGDMGWNILDSDFSTDEQRILATGEPVRMARGSILVKGKPREIIVDKVPLLEEDRRVGIIGLFRAVDEESDAGVVGEAGIFSFVSATSRYVRAYREEGIDFGLTCVKVVETDACGKLHGNEFAEKVAKRFEELASGLVGNQGMVVRFGQLSFAIVMQLHDEEQKRHLNKEFIEVFNKVESIEGMPCQFEFRAGSATFSQAGSFDQMVRMAEKRMERGDGALAG